MKHTFISWDCCYRNFFHLIDALAIQDYDKNEYEYIFVEQRSREQSDAFNHQYGLKSLADKIDQYKDIYNVRAIFMDEENSPFHWGRACNRGIKEAQGEYISVMDGDVLLPPNFITKLDDMYEAGHKVINMKRCMCPYPLGVSKFSDWMKAKVDYDECLAICPDSDHIPEKTANKGPLMSAHREYWGQTEGFDESEIFSTVWSIVNNDLNRRLEKAAGEAAVCLQGLVSAHPWHYRPFFSDRKNVSIIIDDFKRVQREYIGKNKYKDANIYLSWKHRSKEKKDFLIQNEEIYKSAISLEEVLRGEEKYPLIRNYIFLYLFKSYLNDLKGHLNNAFRVKR